MKFDGSPAWLPKQKPIEPKDKPIFAERPVSASKPIQDEPPTPPNTAGLYPYQAEGVKWLHQRKRALLADEMGLGKTGTSLRALLFGCGAIVVCPASLCLNWAREIYKWRPDLTVALSGNTMHLKHSLLEEFYGKNPAADERIQRFTQGIRNYEKGTLPAPTSGEVVICSFDSLPDIPAVPNPRWLTPVPLGDVTLIIDEVHKVKNRTANRTQKVRLLGRQVRRRWGLSGTPMEGKPDDLYGVLESLDLHRIVFPGKSGRESFAGFLRAFGAKKQFFGGHFRGWEFADEPVEDIAAKLKPVMLRRLQEDVLPNLPPKIYSDMVVPCSPELYAELDELEGSDDWKKLGSNELPPFELMSTVRAKLAADRIDAMRDFADRYEDEEIPLVVFCSHTEPLRELVGGNLRQPRAGWGCITGETPTAQRDLFVNLFQEGLLQGLAVATKAGGVGLTLTRASHALFVDLSYTPSENKQAEDRLKRIGQKAKCVRITRMVADHAVDRRVLEILGGKETLIDATLGETPKKVKAKK